MQTTNNNANLIGKVACAARTTSGGHSRRRANGEGFRQKIVCMAVASAFGAAPMWVGLAQANPTGGVVSAGSATIDGNGSVLTITNSNGAVINWQGFSISQGELTQFIQSGASSSVLNRVVGQDPSVLLGTLQSNGRVFLINPNGMVFGAGAVIDTAGFVASTLGMSDADFAAGRMNFAAGANGAGSIVNQGLIKTSSGGSVYLVAPDITNSGIISTPQGEVLLAAGQSVQMIDAGTPELRVQITAGGSVVNLGSIIAQSGDIGIYGAVIRQAGVVNADTVARNAEGNIVFSASQDITLEAGSVTSASGADGGVHDGGEIRIIADGTLNMRSGAEVHVDGGAQGGNGGFLELSGKEKIALNGTYTGKANAGYQGGALLLDPLDINIVNGGTTLPAGTILATDSPGATLNIDAQDLDNGGFANVQLAATNNITVSEAITNADINGGAAGGSLTLAAGNNVVVNQAIGTSTARFNHDLTLVAGNNVDVNASIFMGTAATGNANLSLRADATYTGLGLTLTPNALGDVNIRSAFNGTPVSVDVLGNITASGQNINFVAGHVEAGNAQNFDTSVSVKAGGNIDLTAAATGTITVAAGNATASASGAGNNTATATAKINVTAGGNLILTGGSISIGGGDAYAAAYTSNTIADTTVAANNTATATTGVTLAATGIVTLAATTGDVSIDAGSAGASAYRNISGNNNTLSGNQTATATNGLSIAAGGALTIKADNGSVGIYGSQAYASAYKNVNGNLNTLPGTHAATATNNLSLSGASISLSAKFGIDVSGNGAYASAYNNVPNTRNDNNLSGNHTASATNGLNIAAIGLLEIKAGTGGSGSLNIGNRLTEAFASAYKVVGGSRNIVDGAMGATATNGIRLTGGSVTLTAADSININNWYSNDAEAYAYKADWWSSGGDNQLKGNDTASATTATRIAATGGALSITTTNGDLNIGGGNNDAWGSAYKYTNANNNALTGDETITVANSLSLTATAAVTLRATNGSVNVSAGSAGASAYQHVEGTGNTHQLRGNHTATATNALAITAGGALEITAGGGDLGIYGSQAYATAYQENYHYNPAANLGNNNVLSGTHTATATNALTLSGTGITLAANNHVDISAGQASAYAYESVRGTGDFTQIGGSLNATATNTLAINASGELRVTAGTGGSGSLNINGSYASASAYKDLPPWWGAGDNQALTGNLTAAASNSLKLSGTNITLAAANNINISGSYAQAYAYNWDGAEFHTGVGGTYHSLSGNHSATADNTLSITASGDLKINAGTGGSGSLNIDASYAQASAYQDNWGGWGGGSHNTQTNDMKASATNGLTLSGNTIELTAADSVYISGSWAQAYAYQNASGGNDHKLTGNMSATANSSLSITATGDIAISGGYVEINASSASASAYKYVNATNSTVSGDQTATATASVSIAARGDVSLTASTSSVNIYGSHASAHAYGSVYGADNNVSGDHTAAASSTIRITAGGDLALRAEHGSIDISGSYASAHAYDNGNGGTITGANKATADAGITLAAGGTLALHASSNVYIDNNSASASASGNRASANNTADASTQVTLSGGNIEIAVTDGDFSIYAASSSDADAYARGSGHNTASANTDVTLAASGNISIEARDGITLSAYYGAYASADGGSADAVNSATANNSVKISAGGTLVLATEDNDIDIYTSSGAEAYAYGSGRNTATANGSASLSGGSVVIETNGGTLNVYHASGYGAYAQASGSSSHANNTATANAIASIGGGSVRIDTALRDESGEIIHLGDVNVTAGTASAYANSDGGSGTASARATASATISGRELVIEAGNVNIGGSSAEGNPAWADARAGSGGIAVAAASASLGGGNIEISADGDIWIVGGGTYVGSSGGVESATNSAMVGSPADTVAINVLGNLDIISGSNAGGYAGILSLGTIYLNVGGNLTLVGGTGTAYTHGLWGSIGPGTGVFSAGLLSPIVVNVTGNTTIDFTTCATCAPVFMQTLRTTLDPEVQEELDRINDESNETGGNGEEGYGNPEEEFDLAETGEEGGGHGMPNCGAPGELGRTAGCEVSGD